MKNQKKNFEKFFNFINFSIKKTILTYKNITNTIFINKLKFINFISSIDILIKKESLKQKNKIRIFFTNKSDFINSIIHLNKKKLLKQKNKTSNIFKDKLKFKISSFNKHLITLISLLFIYLFYLTIPNLYNKAWVQNTIENKLYNEFKINFSISSEISYEILPSPHFTIKNVKFLDDNLEKPRNLSEIKKLKVFISQKNLFYKDKLKIRHISVGEANFSIQKDDFQFFSRFMNSKFSSKELKIKKSNIFLKDTNDEIILIAQIYKSLLFHDNNKFLNKITLEGEIFKIPFIYEFTRDFKKNKNISLLKSKKLKLKIENNTTKVDGTINGLNELSILNLKLNSNYQLDNNVFSFKSKSQELTNDTYKYDGKLNLKPSNLILNVDFEDIKIKKLLDIDSIFFEFFKSGQFLDNNISANINLTSLNILDNKFFDSFKIIYNQKNGIVNIDTSEILSKKIGLLKLSNTKIFYLNDSLLFNGDFILKVKNYSKFYTFFQSPKNVRKPIEEIFFNIQYNISNNQLTINSLKIDNKKVDGANITSLSNINDKQDLEIVNFIEFKKLLNKAFANYDG
jgi:hypothetical protein